MTAYPSLKRWLAAGLTLTLLGVAVYFLTRNGGNRNGDINPVAAQDKKPASQDWVMYGGTPTRNMVNTTAKGLPAEWDVDPQKPVNIKWVAKLGSKAYGGPTIAGGRVFVGTNNMDPRDPKWNFINPKDGKPVDLGVVMCFDEAKGNFNWQAIHQKLPGGQVIDWPYEGICSSPHVEGERMYYVSNRCEVICADVKTGKAIWTLDMISKLGVFPHNISDCSPLLVGDHLWVVTSNGVNEDHINVPAPKAPSFIKVDKKTGNVLWQDNSPTAALVNQKGKIEENFFKQLVNRGELIQHGQWSNPSFAVVKGAPQVIFPGGDGWIYSFDPQGKLIWKFDCNPKDAKYELLGKGNRSDFIGTPVIYKDRVYIGVGQDPEHLTGVGHFWCIDMTKRGDVSPELVTNNTVYPPKTKKNPQSALVWHYGGVCTAEDQKKLRRNYYFGRTMSTAAVHEDIVYITDLNGILHCLDANNGKLHWEANTKSAIWSSPYYADGKVYLGVDAKVVYVYRHGKDPKNAKPLAENDMDGRVRATPVAANGVLYVMTENKLYAIEEKKKK
jgi:outer membrane protein assembly factor BamB